MLRVALDIRYHSAGILALHWFRFVAQYKRWNRPVIWEGHDCHEEVVIPAACKKPYGEIVNMNPKTLDPDTEVMRF